MSGPERVSYGARSTVANASTTLIVMIGYPEPPVNGSELDTLLGSLEHLHAGPATVEIGEDCRGEGDIDGVVVVVVVVVHDFSLVVFIVRKAWAPGPVSSADSTGLPETPSNNAMAGPRTSGP